MGNSVTLFSSIVIVFLLDLTLLHAISVSLRDSYVVLGQPFRWDCLVAEEEDVQSGLEPWSYHWRFQDADITRGGGESDGGTVVNMGNGTLVFTEVKEENLGYYTCVVADGQTASEGGAFLKKAFVSGTISTQPTNQRIGLGEAAMFQCTVDAKPEADVTWYHDDEEIDDTDEASITSADKGNFTLKITKVTYDVAGDYRCLVHHPLLVQPLSADPMTLEVTGQPVMVISPKPVTSPVGYNVSLPCRARSNPASSVTWTIYPSDASTSSLSPSSSSSSSSSTIKLSKGDSPIRIAESVVSLNEDGDLILITNASNDSSGVYACKWINQFGSVEVNATLTVEGSPRQPEFTQVPKSQDILELSELRLHCAGTGNPSADVSWILPDGSERIIDDVDDSILVVDEVKKRDAGIYKCVISNSEGMKEINVTVNVLFKPYFITIPSNITIKALSDANISCEADGNPRPTIKWVLPEWDHEVFATSNTSLDHISFDGNSVLIRRAHKLHYGKYQCIATNSVGTISASAEIKVVIGPTIETPLTSVGATEGDEILLGCEVRSYQSPTVHWFHMYMPDPSIQAVNVKDTLGIVSDDDFNTTGTGIVKIEIHDSTRSEFTTYTNVNNDDYMFYLQIESIEEKDAGIYVCKATNNEGSVHTFGVVRVITFPKFNVTPTGDKVVVGDDAILHCHSVGIPVPSQRWVFNGGKLTTDPRYVVHSNGSLSISNITQHEIGTYTCLATNQAGQRSAKAKLSLSSKPRLIVPPKDQTFMEYRNGSLRCQGYSDSPFSIKWYGVDKSRNRVNLIGEQRMNSSNTEYSGEGDRLSNQNIAEYTVFVNDRGALIFMCVEKLHQGWYLCELENEDGSTESDPVFVQVETLPGEIAITDPDTNPKEGDDIELRCSVGGLSHLLGNISWVTPQLIEIPQSGHAYYPEVVVDNTETLLQDETIHLSILTISGVSNTRHGGDWWCKTCNGVGCSGKEIKLVVEGKPVIRHISSASDETHVTINCRSYGDPKPDVNFFSDDIEIINDTPGHVITNHTLIVGASDLKSEYSCRASNVYGSDVKTIGVPPSPAITNVIPGQKALHAAANVNTSQTYGSLTKLVLEYKMSDSDHDWESQTYQIDCDVMKYLNALNDLQDVTSNKTCSQNANGDIDSVENPIERNKLDGVSIYIDTSSGSFVYSFRSVITNLNAYTLYSIKATLVSVLGQSQSSEIVNTRTLPSPPSAVTNPRVSVKNRSCILSWVNPIELNGNAEDITINIEINRESDDNVIQSKTVPVIDVPTAEFFDLSSREYIATITAFNTKTNASSESVLFYFNTQDQAPNYIPEILEIRSITHASMTVIWKIPDGLDTLMPPVTGYKLLMKFTDVKGGTRIVLVNNGRASNQTITKLRENQGYSVQIASTNQAGSSPYSQPKRVTTRFAVFSEMALGSADIEGYSVSWTLIAIIIIAAGAAFVFLTAFMVFSYQWKLARRGSVDITPDPTTDDVRYDARNYVMNDPRPEEQDHGRVMAEPYRDSDFILY